MQNISNCARIVAVALGLSATSATASTQDLGVVGPVWGVVEQDMRLAMALDAAAVDWGAVHDDLSRQAERITADLDGWLLPQAEHTSTRYIDPSIVVEEDIEGYVQQEDGSYAWSVLYPAGTRANPLEQAQPHTWQLVIDGKNESQMQLAEQIMARHYQRVILVLTRGNPGEIAKQWDFPVYFAQEWHFTRFGVTHTPSLVGVSPERPLEVQVTHFAYPYPAETVEGFLP